MIVEYKNKYGDTITFTEIDKHHIKVESSLELGIRGGKTSKDKDFIDFSGGPFIAVDDYLGVYHKDLEEKKVKSIKFNNGIILEV